MHSRPVQLEIENPCVGRGFEVEPTVGIEPTTCRLRNKTKPHSAPHATRATAPLAEIRPGSETADGLDRLTRVYTSRT